MITTEFLWAPEPYMPREHVPAFAWRRSPDVGILLRHHRRIISSHVAHHRSRPSRAQYVATTTYLTVELLLWADPHGRSQTVRATLRDESPTQARLGAVQALRHMGIELARADASNVLLSAPEWELPVRPMPPPIELRELG